MIYFVLLVLEFVNINLPFEDDDSAMISELVSSLKCNRDKSEMHVHRHSREGNQQTYIPEGCCIKS